jgi:hypothetical protein
VRLDVVYHRGCPDNWRVFLGTQSAERVFGEISLAVPAPPGIIATLRGGAPFSVILPDYLAAMLIAVAAFIMGEFRTSRLPAWMSWFVWH